MFKNRQEFGHNAWLNCRQMNQIGNISERILPTRTLGNPWSQVMPVADLGFSADSFQASDISEPAEVYDAIENDLQSYSTSQLGKQSFESAVEATGSSVLKLVLLGKETSSKEALADSVATERHIPHVHMGALIKQELAAKTKLGMNIAKAQEAGNKSPADLMGQLIERRLSGKEFENGYILDAFPSDVGQAEIVKVLSRDSSVRFIELTNETSTPTNSTLRKAEAEGTYFQLEDSGDTQEVGAVLDAMVENFSSANQFYPR
jgi:hypothetical protein